MIITLITTTSNHPGQLHQERRRQKEEDEAEQYRKLSVQEAAYRKLSQQYEVCDMQKLHINIEFYCYCQTRSVAPPRVT